MTRAVHLAIAAAFALSAAWSAETPGGDVDKGEKGEKPRFEFEILYQQRTPEQRRRDAESFGRGNAINFNSLNALDRSDRDLKAAAQRDLAAFDRYRKPGALHDAAYAIEEYMRKQGYAQAKVRFVRMRVQDQVERVVFEVEAGPLAHLGAVTFDGMGKRFAKHEDQVAKLFAVRRGKFGIFAPVYDASLIEGAVHKLERKYLLDGYYRVTVGKVEEHWNRDATRVDLKIPIQEGPRYLVDAVEVEVVRDVAGIQKRMARAKAILIGKPFHARLAAETAAQLRAWLQDHGHLQATVKASSRIDDASASAVIRIRVDPGPVVRVRAIRITATRTKESFIRKRLGLEPGEVWNQGALDAGIRELYRSGLYRAVHVRPVDSAGDDNAQQADIEVVVDELPGREVDLEAGWGSYEMLRGSARYRERNLWGYGRGADIGVDASMRSYGADAGYTDYFTFGPHSTFSLRPRYEVREEPSFDSTAVSVDTILTYQYTPPWRFRVGHEYRTERAENVQGPIPAVESADFVTTSALIGRIYFDRRDSVVIPTTGWLSEAGIKWSAPLLGAELAFIEYSTAFHRYERFSPDFVGVVGVRYITRQILDGEPSLPIQERLFLGGDTTVRSFGKDELGPSDAEGDPIGGLTSAVASVEARQRLVKDLHGALFYDIGSVGENTWTLSWPAGQAIGGGLRWLLPIGPIRLDGAWNPGPLFAADKPWAVHFSIGFSF